MRLRCEGSECLLSGCIPQSPELVVMYLSMATKTALHKNLETLVVALRTHVP